jgi:hypothetical protein
VEISKFLYLTKETNLLDVEAEVRVKLEVDAPLIRAGLIKEIGANEFVVLLAIASYMDDNGNCYPTQRQIKDITGWSLDKVNKTINSLLEKQIDGKYLLSREFVQNGRAQSSYYTILTEMNQSEPVEEPKEDKPLKTAKDVMFLFAGVYEETYGVSYNLNWGREGKLVKSKLIGKFTDEQIRTMINVGVREYSKRWANKQFPRPTISMICTWLGNNALALADELNKEQAKIEARKNVEIDQELNDLL